MHVLVTKEVEPAYIPPPKNLGLRFKRRMLYFPMDIGELTLDGPIDNGAHSSAISEADLRKTRLLAPQSIIKEGPAPSFQIMIGNGDFETPMSTVELKLQVGDIEFHEIFIVIEKLSSPIIGLMFLQRNHTVPAIDVFSRYLFAYPLIEATYPLINILKQHINKSTLWRIEK